MKDLQGYDVPLPSLTRYLLLRYGRDYRHLSKLLPVLDIGEMNLDYGQGGIFQGVTQGEPVMCKRSGVYNDARCFFCLLLDEIYQIALMVGLV